MFFGTPDFAVPTLKALIEAPFCDVSLVVTQPDKPVGRHHSRAVPSPVKRIAQEAGIPVVTQPPPYPLLNTGGGRRYQLGILVAYGEIIPKEIIDAFPLGILNIHPSLLPKYRGASPIQAAILNQDKETGVTIMKLDDKMDHGPVLAQETVSLRAGGQSGADAPLDGRDALSQSVHAPPIRRVEAAPPPMTAGELRDALAQLGARLLIKILPDYIAGRIKPKPQDDAQASYTQKLTKQDGRIDWSEPALAINAQVRALNPWPGAWTEWEGKRLIIWSMRKDGTPAEVQLEGKKRMRFDAFIRGRKKKVSGAFFDAKEKKGA